MDGTVFIGSGKKSDLSGYLYAIKPDGTLRWKYQAVMGVCSSPAISSDGTIYIVSGDNKALPPYGTVLWNPYLYEFKPDGSLKGKYLSGSDYYQSYSLNYFSPAIGSDGTVFVGSAGFYALGGMPTGKGAIHGFAKDLSTDKAIPGVTISTTATETQTDTDGSYTIVLFPGVYDITFSKTGYQTRVIDNVLVDEGKVTELNGYFVTPGPLNIVTTSLPAAEITITYNSRAWVTGGTNPYTHTIASGTPPPGLNP